MRRTLNALILIMVIAGITLAAISPDYLSMAIVVIMAVILLLGSIFGLFQVVSCIRAFQSAKNIILNAENMQIESIWRYIEKNRNIFNQKMLNQLFFDYADKVEAQKKSNQLISNIEEYINEDVISLKTWQGVILQIPSTLTGLGILGTFIGLIIGIRNIGFSSVTAALTSVQLLLSGIETAFYTSIVGVILSILFNIISRLSWNTMLREYGIFIDLFHKSVLPTEDEQSRYAMQKDIAKVISLLERIPKTPAYSISSGKAGGSTAAETEQIMMPQIIEGMKNEEFEIYLQPKYNLGSRQILGAEALVRWNHPKLGMISPAVFLPVLEANGYITKLDQYVWERVCRIQKKWNDSGRPNIPITVNITKTDILALNIPEIFSNLIAKYELSPRAIEIDIAMNAYQEIEDSAIETERLLRQSGFRVIVDGFNGDFFSLNHTQADALKWDLRNIPKVTKDVVQAAFDKAQELHMVLTVEGIENMNQLNLLRKSGCTEGQGYYLSKPLSLAGFEKLHEN